MRPRISIRGSVRPSVRPFVRPSVTRFLNEPIMDEIVQTHQKVFRNVPRCPKMSRNAHFRRIIVRMDLFKGQRLVKSATTTTTTTTTTDMYRYHVAVNNAIRKIFSFAVWQSVRTLRTSLGYQSIYEICSSAKATFLANAPYSSK